MKLAAWKFLAYILKIIQSPSYFRVCKTSETGFVSFRLQGGEKKEQGILRI
jgi:hypothetical protein